MFPVYPPRLRKSIDRKGRATLKFPVDIDLFIRAGKIEYGCKVDGCQREFIEEILAEANRPYCRAISGECVSDLYSGDVVDDMDEYEAQHGAVTDRECVLKMANLWWTLCREAAEQGTADRPAVS
jgi:hypothetical protein